MNNTKENNIKRALWHIKRHCNHIENNHSNSDITAELFYLKSSVEVLLRIFNDEKPYPKLDREEVF
jgi:hypothetical protein